MPPAAQVQAQASVPAQNGQKEQKDEFDLLFM